MVAMPGAKHHKLIRLHKVQIETGTLIKHIRIEALWPQQTDPGNEFPALGDEFGKFTFKI